jgi:ParB/RepB/Spo0J family partition protein
MIDSQPTRLRKLSPDQISPNPENPRLIFRQEEMESLMVSIDTYGIQVPIAVYADGNRFVLIDGERRWRCAKKLNLRQIPALVQDRPSELENLLLMYNIHALREQWDYFTIASKLERIIALKSGEEGIRPTETELSEATGLSRGQIRRCQLLLDLPDRFKDMLTTELELPKAQQKLSEDFFIEMERSLKTITKRLPEYNDNLDGIRDTLVDKFKTGIIPAVTDFRQLSKIATAVDNLGIRQRTAKAALDRIFKKNDVDIRGTYEATVEFEYDEHRASQHLTSLTAFLDEVIEEDRVDELDPEFLELIRKLRTQLNKLLRAEK